MQSLINIRVKYLLRHPCLLFWSYIFLPLIFFLFSIYLFKTDEPEKPPKHFKNEPEQSGEDFFFNKIINGTKTERTYESLKKFLPNTVVIINDDTYCDKIKNFFVNETNINVNCSYYTKKFSNDTSHIINIEKKEDKFQISLIERQREDSTILMFERGDLDQDKITDLFYINNVTHNKTTFEEKKFKRFWELESLLAKLLIKLNNKEIKSDLKMNIGFNSYPEHYRYSDTNTFSFYTLLSFIISLQFSIIGYNFNMRMIDEKENRLNILLERQGISKFKYHISWLISFFNYFFFNVYFYFHII